MSGVEAGGGRTSWSVRPWRLVPPALVLLTVVVIWATRWDQLMANNWAYPVTLLVVGGIALLLLIRARPRRSVLDAAT